MKENINNVNIDNLKYIELNFDISKMSENTVDGVHYNEEFSKEIYDNILSKINKY